MKNLVEVSEERFETEVLRAGLPVIVDFYAPWCGPCKMLAPLLDQLAGEFQGRIKFAKVNVDDAGHIAAAYGVTGVPTLMLFRDGQAVDSMVGLSSPRALRTWLDQAASASAHSGATLATGGAA